MIRSFHCDTVPRARATRRSTTRPGVTFSVRASTSPLRLSWVRSMSRRIASGSWLPVP
jgi:hypothetical protein